MDKHPKQVILNTGYILFLDDERTIEMVDRSSWPNGLHILIARSSVDAKMIAEAFGDPLFCSFDHDLGGIDTVMEFLKWYADCDDRVYTNIPKYVVHSANPTGAKNIVSFMESWKRSLTM
jgi:hypothetical protein